MDMKELAGKLEAGRKELETIFTSKPEMNFSEEELSSIRQKNAELKDLQVKYDALIEADNIKSANELALSHLENTIVGGVKFAGPQTQKEVKSFGELFVAAPEYKSALRSGYLNHFAFEMNGVSLKTVMTTTNGYAPDYPRTNIVLDSRKPLTIADLIRSTNTNATNIRFMEVTTRTNNAAPVAENALKPESGLALTERDASMEVIAHIIPVTRQQLEDVDGIMAFLNDQMTFMLKEAEENQLLNGTGVAPELQGILTRTGLQTQAKGTDNVPDALFKALTKVRTGARTVATNIVLNPVDWQDIRLMKDANQNYIFGAPSMPDEGVLFGYKVVQSEALVAGTGLVGDFSPKSVYIWRKNGIRIEVSDSHSDYFAYNKLAVRVEERVAQTVLRPAGFCKVNLTA